MSTSKSSAELLIYLWTSPYFLNEWYDGGCEDVPYNKSDNKTWKSIDQYLPNLLLFDQSDQSGDDRDDKANSGCDHDIHFIPPSQIKYLFLDFLQGFLLTII